MRAGWARSRGPSRARAYEQLHLPPYAVLSRATVIKVGELVGAAQVIVGEISVDGDALTVKARPIRIDVGRADTEVTERGSLGDLFALVQKVSRRAVPGGTDAARRSDAVAAGARAIRQGAARRTARDPGLVPRSRPQAGPGLRSRTTGALGSADLAGRPRRRAGRGPGGRRHLARRQARAVSRRRVADVAEAVRRGVHRVQGAAGRGVRTGDPEQPRRRSSCGAPPSADTGKPAYYFTKAAEAEPDDPDLLFNLGYAYALDRDPQGAIYWLRESLRRNPVDGDAHFVLASALDTAGSSRRSRPRARAGRTAVAAAGRRRVGAARRAAARPRARRASISSRYAATASTRRSPTPPSATSATSRSSTSSAAGGCSRRSRIARRWWSCGARCSCRPTRPRRTC